MGRWAVDGEDDLPAVRTRQDGLIPTPTTDGADGGLPEAHPTVAEDIIFFERMRTWMQAFPPAGRDLDGRSFLELVELAGGRPDDQAL